MMSTAGLQVTTSDTSDGVAIAFTTSGDVAELRARVRHMADMHNRMAGKHGGEEGEMGNGGDMHDGAMGMGGMRMVPSRASVEDIPGGAHLVLVPTDPSQLEALRQQARVHAEMMQQGRCPMMEAPPPPEPGTEDEQHHPGGV